MRVQRANMVSEVIIVLRSDNFAPYDINVRVLVILLSIVQTRGIRSWTVGLVIPRGNPKYVKGIEPTLQPKMEAMSL